MNRGKKEGAERGKHKVRGRKQKSRTGKEVGRKMESEEESEGGRT